MKPYIFKNVCIPLPVVSDNCSTMVALNKYSDGAIFKIFWIEHKLAIIDKNLHKNSQFSHADAQINAINSYFNHRHGQFNLPMKPPQYASATRPWRSHLHNYKVI